MAFEISPGEYLRVTVNWTNTGSQTHDFLLEAYYGKIVDKTMYYWDKTQQYESNSNPGETRDTNLDFIHPFPTEDPEGNPTSGQTVDVYVRIIDPETNEVLDEYPDPGALYVK